MVGRSLSNSLVADQEGSALMEFGLIAIVFITMVLGMMDIGQAAYTQAVLNGAAQEVARAASLETRDVALADAELEKIVQRVAPNAKLTPKRVSYFDFEDISRSESFRDTNGDGVCNNDENYDDENGNGQWDEDIGVEGNGNASDVVVYTVSAEYKPLFAIPFYDDGESTRTLSATFVKKNQPFERQEGYGNTVEICS
ncbi:TadE/TadG family type IV pilus assembly protein [Qipengyuania sp. NPDC077563]|uniref:TadE/TadG family type IV pilus assembly protein n=1 Tax=Qipengyuania sp. NPDC077563 TaxID=3364497 RepID=UPI00384C92F4